MDLREFEASLVTEQVLSQPGLCYIEKPYLDKNKQTPFLTMRGNKDQIDQEKCL